MDFKGHPSWPENRRCCPSSHGPSFAPPQKQSSHAHNQLKCERRKSQWITSHFWKNHCQTKCCCAHSDVVQWGASESSPRQQRWPHCASSHQWQSESTSFFFGTKTTLLQSKNSETWCSADKRTWAWKHSNESSAASSHHQQCHNQAQAARKWCWQCVCAHMELCNKLGICHAFTCEDQKRSFHAETTFERPSALCGATSIDKDAKPILPLFTNLLERRAICRIVWWKLINKNA